MYTTYFIEYVVSNSKYWKEIVNESPPKRVVFVFFFLES